MRTTNCVVGAAILAAACAFAPPHCARPRIARRAAEGDEPDDEPRPSYDDEETLWRAHSKPLLRVGKAGVAPSHVRSLTELLGAHGHVCVKINGVDEAGVAAASAALCEEGAVVVMTKSNSVLFAAAPAEEASPR